MNAPGLITSIIGRRSKNAVAARAAGIDRYLGYGLLAAIALLTAGWLAPIMTVKRLLILDERMSLMEGLVVLAEYGQFLLFFIVLIFAVCFPIARITLTFRLWRNHDVFSETFETRLRLVEGLGKWSMLDVFLIALVVAATNVSLIADVHLHWGLYTLAAGVLLSMGVSTRISAVAHKLRRGEDGPSRSNLTND